MLLQEPLQYYMYIFEVINTLIAFCVECFCVACVLAYTRYGSDLNVWNIYSFCLLHNENNADTYVSSGFLKSLATKRQWHCASNAVHSTQYKLKNCMISV